MEYLSHSRIDVFLQCPRLFKLRYIDHALPENETTDFYSKYGSLLHKIVELKMNSRGFMPKAAMIDILHNGYNGDGERDKVVGYSEVGVPNRYNKKYQRYLDDLYYDQALEFIQRLDEEYTASDVIGTEVEFLITLDDNTPPVKGYIDLVRRSSDGIEIWDFKTSENYGQAKCDRLPQVSIYGLAALELYGELPVRYVYDFIRVGERIVTYRTPEQLEETRQSIIQTWRDICESDWEPKYNYFYCSNFCDHNVSCPLYQAKHNKG
jgi:RecB family exonuclease